MLTVAELMSKMERAFIPMTARSYLTTGAESCTLNTS
jgi:hypothetical protein